MSVVGIGAGVTEADLLAMLQMPAYANNPLAVQNLRARLAATRAAPAGYSGTVEVTGAGVRPFTGSTPNPYAWAPTRGDGTARPVFIGLGILAAAILAGSLK